MIHLPTVDLVVTEGVDSERIIFATLHTLSIIKFRRVLLFAPTLPPVLARRVRYYHAQCTYETWNALLVRDLTHYVSDGHALTIHEDGFPLNAKAWEDSWLQYDYIGAPWGMDGEHTVGNGGFALRSANYLRSGAALGLTTFAPEDWLLVRIHADRMSHLKFAPPEVAAKFSLEANGKYGTVWDGQFGFHNYHITDISKSGIAPPRRDILPH